MSASSVSRATWATVVERLVDRQPLDHRGGVVEDLEHGLAGVGVGRHPGRNEYGLRALPPRLGAAHRRPDAARLGLVGGGEHYPHSDDDRLIPKPGIVPTLDRRVERVE